MPNEDRLDDHTIEETPAGDAADAPTPPQGTPSARMRRATSAVTRPIDEPKPKPSRPVYKAQNRWTGAVLVAAFCLVFTVALTLFMVYSGDPAAVNAPGVDPGTENEPHRGNQESGQPRGNQSHRSAADGNSE